jgi:cytochrome c biogenesis protein CcmG/thiol:disulfide interchange protein DsbE
MVPRDELNEHHNRSKLRRLAPAAVVAIGLVGVLVYGLLRPAPEEAARADPEFELPLLSGEGMLSDEDLEGQVVVLNFWASWCHPCRQEMPMFERVAREYQARNVTFIGVTWRDVPEAARAFVRKYGITYRIVHDDARVLGKQLDVTGLPQTFFLDRTGAVSGSRVLGEMTRAELVARIDEVVEGTT